MPGHRTWSKNQDTVVHAAAAAADTQPSKGACRLCQGHVTRAATAAIAQVSKRTAIDKGTVVCSANAAVMQATKGMVVDAGVPYLALGDGTTSGEDVRIVEGNVSTALGGFITIYWALARPQALEVWMYPRAAEEQRACQVISH